MPAIELPSKAPTIAPQREGEIQRDFDPEVLRRLLPPHKVIVHDNDYTPFDAVTKILLKAVPGMTRDRALALTWEIHTSGAAVPYVGPKERAEAIASVIRTIGIKVTVEPDE